MLKKKYPNRANGGKAAGVVVKAKHLKLYLENPNKCLCCGADIIPKGTQSISEVKVKKFCNASCAAIYNNKSRTVDENKRPIKRRRDISLPTKERDSKNSIGDLTKGNLKDRTDNWWEGRVPISKDARRVYKRSAKPKECLICKYSRHYQVCHLKAVSDFDDTTQVKEINNLDNLVALCPNHHWELDHGYLSISIDKNTKETTIVYK